MSEIITISNGTLTVKISTLGAQMNSMKCKEEEFLKTEKTAVWEDSAPVLFPICGCLKDDKYKHNGKEYTLFAHGFAYTSEFDVENKDNSSVIFVLNSSEETLKKYPFDFEFKVKYEIVQNTLKIEYHIKNTGTNDMYFSVGSHEAYACPNGIEEYSLVFEYDEKLDISLLDGALLNGKKENMAKSSNELPLKYDYYNHVDTLVFENLKSRSVELKNNKTGKTIKVEYPDAENLLIWTKPYEKYVCIEPWSGLPDFVDSDYDITKKPGIIKLGAGETTVKKHSIIL